MYTANPISLMAKAWHNVQNNQSTTSTSSTCKSKQCEINLINIQGLITNNKNKSKYLMLKTLSKAQHHILVVTETWIQPNKHYDAEILKAFPNYSLKRSDRHLILNPLDPFQLKSRGTKFQPTEI